MTNSEAIKFLEFFIGTLPKEPPEGIEYVLEWERSGEKLHNALDLAIEALKKA